MTLRVYVLRGGMWGWDGPATSLGMDSLAKQIEAVTDVKVSVHNWTDWYTVSSEIFSGIPADTPVAIVGYSGGGLYAAYISRMIYGRVIDLIVALDPSPAAAVKPQPRGKNVRKAICYYNRAPWLLGYGGGVLRGHQVEVRNIAENHLAVQFDAAIRAGTVAAIREAAAHA